MKENRHCNESPQNKHLPQALGVSEHLNREIDIERFVPPENVYHEIHGGTRKRDDFEMGDWKVFNGPCGAQPRCLNDLCGNNPGQKMHKE